MKFLLEEKSGAKHEMWCKHLEETLLLFGTQRNGSFQTQIQLVFGRKDRSICLNIMVFYQGASLQLLDSSYVPQPWPAPGPCVALTKEQEGEKGEPF